LKIHSHPLCLIEPPTRGMLVVMNPGSLPASVKIETFDSSGYAVSSADLFLDPGARSSRLIEDSQTANRNGGSMLIKASSVVLALQIMGSPGTGGSLAVLPAHAGAGESEQAVPLLSAMNGGTAVSIDRGARISIPPGAMEHDAAIQITPLHVDDFPKPSGAETLAGVVQGTPTGTRFKKPVQITFPLAESIPAGTGVACFDFQSVNTSIRVQWFCGHREWRRKDGISRRYLTSQYLQCLRHRVCSSPS
jgi:hypothetical protein